jgi:hypothetical protein
MNYSNVLSGSPSGTTVNHTVQDLRLEYFTDVTMCHQELQQENYHHHGNMPSGSGTGIGFQLELDML